MYTSIQCSNICWPSPRRVWLAIEVGQWWKGVLGQQNNCKTLTGVHLAMHLMHPNYNKVLQLFLAGHVYYWWKQVIHGSIGDDLLLFIATCTVCSELWFTTARQQLATTSNTMQNTQGDTAALEAIKDMLDNRKQLKETVINRKRHQATLGSNSKQHINNKLETLKPVKTTCRNCTIKYCL